MKLPKRSLEVNFGIAAACLPAIHPGYLLLKSRVSSYRSSRRSSETSSKKAFVDRRLAPIPSPPKVYHPDHQPDQTFSCSDGMSESKRATRDEMERPAPMPQLLDPRLTQSGLRINIDRSLARIETEDSRLERGDLVYPWR